MKDKVIADLKAADITVDDWHWNIIESIPDLFARGWLKAKIDSLNGVLLFKSEDFRQELIEQAGYNIWDQK